MTLWDCIMALAKDTFFKYQYGWTQLWYSGVKYIGLLGGRQLGKDYWLEFVMACELMTRWDTDWVVISATRGHAKIFLRGVRRWVTVLAALAVSVGAPSPRLLVDSAFDIVTDWGTTVSVASGTVRSLTGRRGGVVLNEVPLIPDAKDLFPSAFAQVDRAVALGKHAKLIMIGNASFVGTYWHSWWTARLENPGQWHLVTQPWSEAMISLGWSKTQVNQKWREIVSNLNGNEGAARQWYECDWRAPQGALFHPDLLSAQSYDDTDKTFGKKAIQAIGYDVGRITDPSAWARLVLDDGKGWGLPVEQHKAMPIPEQRAKAKELALLRETMSMTVDATGMGRTLMDDLRRDMGRVCPVNDFTIGAHNKWELLGLLLVGLQDDRVRLPLSDTGLRMQLETIQTELTDRDQVKVLIPRVNGAHGDKAIALALAVHGAKSYLRVSPPASKDLIVRSDDYSGTLDLI